MYPQKMAFSAICPFVRYAEDVRIPRSKVGVPTIAYDHRLFYVVSGRVLMELDGMTQEFGPGGVLYCMSGTPYSFCAAGDEAPRLIKLNFDFTQANAAQVQPIPVATKQDWDPSHQLETIVFTDAALLNTPLLLPEVPQLLPYLHTIIQESVIPLSFGTFQLSNLIRIILTLLYREAMQRHSPKKVPNAARSILDYVNLHYADILTNRSLAAQFGYHPNYISCLVLEQTGLPLHRYLLRVRIRQAVNLLTTTHMPVAEIALAVGFKSASYFSHYFRQCTGHTPGKFRME